MNGVENSKSEREVGSNKEVGIEIQKLGSKTEKVKIVEEVTMKKILERKRG